MIATEIVEGMNGLQAIEEEWRALVGDSFSAVFSRPEWHRAWLDAFPPKQIALVTARLAGRLVGLLPLSLIRSDARGLYLSLVAPIARGDYQSPIVEAAAAHDALPAMLDAAVRRFGRHTVYWFPNIPSDAPALPILLSYMQRRGMVYSATTEVAPRLHINGRTYREIEAAWSAGHRKEVRNKRRRMAALGELCLWRPRTLDEALPALEEFFAVHDEKWLSQGRPARFRNPQYRRHFMAMAQRLWNRGLHLTALRCGATNVFTSMSFVSDGWVLLYRPAMRLEYQKHSPGTVFISMLIEEACRLSWQGIDFLLGAEDFKFRWSNDTLKVVGLHAAFSAWSLPYQWFARGKPYMLQRLEPEMARAKACVQRALTRAPSPAGSKL
ncbi:MAG TPA: GNAT family N-acetyltransferase [Gammaproteobacteria bacterium]|nr:GNAT family N-acetyltransferase [Gammaproteobacteria bacterium]